MLLALLLLTFILVSVPFAMPTWRTFVALCAFYLLIQIGVVTGIAVFDASDVHPSLVMLGNLWIDVLIYLVPIPVIARAVVLALRSGGLSGRWLLAANIVGVLALPGTYAGIILYGKWDRRAAPVSCTDRPISFTLSDVAGAAPWSHVVSLYLGQDLRADARRLFSVRHRRQICRATSNGTKVLNIEALTINTRNRFYDLCREGTAQSWEARICQGFKNGDSYGYQFEAGIFTPDGIRIGYFSIPVAETNKNYPIAENEILKTTSSPGVGLVSAVCREPYSPNGTFFCRMRRPLTAHVSIYWKMSAPEERLEERMLRVESLTREICSSILDADICRGSD